MRVVKNRGLMMKNGCVSIRKYVFRFHFGSWVIDFDEFFVIIFGG